MEICLVMKPVRTLKLPLMISKCIPSTPETFVYYYSHFTDKDSGALEPSAQAHTVTKGRWEAP